MTSNIYVTPLGTIELPATWTDETIFRWAEPVTPPADASVPSSRIPTTLTLMTVSAPNGIVALIQQLRASALTDLAETNFESCESWQHSRGDEVPTLDYSHALVPGQRIRQLHLFLGGGSD